jgi:hypothetical protein
VYYIESQYKKTLRKEQSTHVRRTRVRGHCAFIIQNNNITPVGTLFYGQEQTKYKTWCKQRNGYILINHAVFITMRIITSITKSNACLRSRIVKTMRMTGRIKCALHGGCGECCEFVTRSDDMASQNSGRTPHEPEFDIHVWKDRTWM